MTLLSELVYRAERRGVGTRANFHSRCVEKQRHCHAFPGSVDCVSVFHHITGDISWHTPSFLLPPSSLPARRNLRLTQFLAAALVFPAGAFAADPGVSFSPATLDFNAVAIGETKKLTATLANTTALDVVLSGASLPGPHSASFSFTTTCGDTLAAGQGCVYTIAYNIAKAKALKPRMAQLDIATGDPAFPLVSLPLRGNPYPSLNDTCITNCANKTQVNLPCPQTDFPGQDAEYGRDQTQSKPTDGTAGFNFTKLDGNGKDLPVSASEWNCVRDNVTGLIWERKPVGDGVRGNQGLHDADDTYTWYSTDATNNGGFVGYPNQKVNRKCSGFTDTDATTYCNTEAYVQRVNAAGWCVAKDWRMPTYNEVYGLLVLGSSTPAIDRLYFPDTLSTNYWSGSPYASSSGHAWIVEFRYGSSDSYGRDGAGAGRFQERCRIFQF